MKKHGVTRIILLVHSRIAVFEWGKVIVESFIAQATKNKYILSIVHDVNEINERDCPIVIIGVDSEWLNGTIDKLNFRRNRIVLIHGVAHKNYEYVSHISADQGVTVQKCINLLREQGRTRTAFFGAQKNDSSDNTKTLAFSKCFSPMDVYSIDGSVEECFERLMLSIDSYDSIICSNDVMAIYLIARFRALGINIPERLHLIGNGNLWLASRVTPSLTTVSYNSDATVRLALQLCEDLNDYENLSSINVSVSTQIIVRNSTGAVSDTGSRDGYTSHKRAAYMEYGSEALCGELSEIVSIDRALSACSEEQISVLRLWIVGQSVDAIAEKLFMSRDTVKYHLKTTYKQLGIHSKAELTKLVNKYGLTL